MKKVAFAIAAALVGLVGCRPPCMQPDYARAARGSSEYQLSASTAAGERLEHRGLGPETLTMHVYAPFQCAWSGRQTQPNHFYVELGPRCRLLARVESHLNDHDSGSISRYAFIQSESVLVEGGACELALDDGRTVTGRVRAGTLVVRPKSAALDVSLDVDRFREAPVQEGKLRLSMSAAWSGGGT